MGSIIESVSYGYTDSGWADLLTNYDDQPIFYDAIGNPTEFADWYLDWQGRELIYLYDSYSDFDLSFAYNADGIRTIKNYLDLADGSSTFRHEYILNGSQIITEIVYEDDTEAYMLVYLYDENGSPIGFRYRTPSYAEGVFDGYFYEKNIQGDIIGIWNQNGTKLAAYTYDAWGKVTVTYCNGGASTAARYNPFTYRGYYYDSETGLYYLQSRYYNPEWGRFLNADAYINANGDLIGFNMFAYCSNNPVMGCDPCGQSLNDWRDNLTESFEEWAEKIPKQ